MHAPCSSAPQERPGTSSIAAGTKGQECCRLQRLSARVRRPWPRTRDVSTKTTRAMRRTPSGSEYASALGPWHAALAHRGCRVRTRPASPDRPRRRARSSRPRPWAGSGGPPGVRAACWRAPQATAGAPCRVQGCSASGRSRLPWRHVPGPGRLRS